MESYTILKYAIGFIMGCLATMVVGWIPSYQNNYLCMDYIAKYNDPLIIVIAHDPDMQHLAESHWYGNSVAIRIKDEDECLAFQKRITKETHK